MRVYSKPLTREKEARLLSLTLQWSVRHSAIKQSSVSVSSLELKAAFPVAAMMTDLAAQVWLSQQAPGCEWPGSRELGLAECLIGGEPVPLCRRHGLSLSERSKLPIVEHRVEFDQLSQFTWDWLRF